MTENGVYDVRSPRAPILRGAVLRLTVGLLEKPLVAAILGPTLTRDLGLRELRARKSDAPPVFLPLHGQRDFCSGNATALEGVTTASSRGQDFRSRTIRDFARAYENGVVTPETVADRVLTAIKASDDAVPPLLAFIAVDRDDVMSQARDATGRYKQGHRTDLWTAYRSRSKTRSTWSLIPRLPEPDSSGASQRRGMRLSLPA